jgi:hypothetical protein
MTESPDDSLPYPLTDCGERGQELGQCCGFGCVDCKVWCNEELQ